MTNVIAMNGPTQPEIDTTRFAQAVQLAAAFVANGDIRKGQRWGTPLLELEDALPLLYQMLERAEALCAPAADDPG